MVAAVVASVIGGLAAIALSLPLRSPDDVFFNTATVAAGAILAGLVLGAVWREVGGRVARFEIAVGAAFVLTVAAIFAGERMLTGMLAFALPLAAVVLGSIAALTPLLAQRALPTGVVAAVVPVLALGWVLADRGDAEVRALSLPTASSATVAATATAAGATASSTPGTAGASASAFRTPADVRGVVFKVGQGSEAQFTVREKLAQFPLPNDATMRNTAVTGDVHLDGASTIRIDLQQLTSDQSQRDRFIRDQFRRQPTATVTIDNLGALPVQYNAGDVVKQKVSGRLNILGNEAPIAFDVEARLEGDSLSILGRTTFHWADFKIPPPNTPSVRVEDEVNVSVLLVAKAVR